MHQPDSPRWLKTSDGDCLIVDEDSGNDYGERKCVLPIDAETLQLEQEGKGYFLAEAGGGLNSLGRAGVAAIPDTFARATSSEFSGSWNDTLTMTTSPVVKVPTLSFWRRARAFWRRARALKPSWTLKSALT